MLSHSYRGSIWNGLDSVALLINSAIKQKLKDNSFNFQSRFQFESIRNLKISIFPRFKNGKNIELKSFWFEILMEKNSLPEFIHANGYPAHNGCHISIDFSTMCWKSCTMYLPWECVCMTWCATHARKQVGMPPFYCFHMFVSFVCIDHSVTLTSAMPLWRILR